MKKLTAKTALKIAREWWGVEGAVEELLSAATYEQRREAQARLDSGKTESAKERNQLRGICRSFRCTVGRSGGFAFVVYGQGDTWEEAIDVARLEVEREHARAKERAERKAATI